MKRAVLALALVACRRDGVDSHGGAADRVAKASRAPIATRVLLTGELKAGTTTDLGVPTTEAGQLTIRWMAEDGAMLKAGERALEYDNSAFTNGLEQKRVAAVEAASAFATTRDLAAMAMALKEFELQQHRIALDKAKLLASVPADLISQQAAQQRQLEKARAEVALTKIEKELAAEKQANALEARVKQIELEKAQRAIDDARKTIADLVIVAPRDGLIQIGNHPWEGRRFQVGDTVQPGFTIITMPDFTQSMLVQAELSDVDDGRVTVGMKGTCTLDAYPHEPLPCQVDQVAPVARNKQNQSLRRAFTVMLALEKTDRERMRPGMSVKVALVGAPQEAITVPRGALVLGTKPDEKPRVRLGNGTLREVTLGACDALRCAVSQGIADGEAVLESGT